MNSTGFFGVGAARHAVVINVVAPGEETEDAVLERAAGLNPAESLGQLRRDLEGE